MLPSKNIFWTDVPKTAKVKLIKNCYVVDGKAVAYWTGNDALAAQTFLNKLVEKSLTK